MSSLSLSVSAQSFKLAEAFAISRGARTEARVVTAHLTDGTHKGWGECVPYARYDETVESVMDEISALAQDIRNALDRQGLQTLMKAGAARNALDCAFWDYEAKRAGKPVWQLAGIAKPQRLTTAYTISLGEPEAMRAKAAQNAHRPLLKVKLGTENDLARIRAVREGAPKSDIIVDANEGWSVANYEVLAPEFVALNVTMVEQPFPAGKDEALRTLKRTLPVCADESCHDRHSLSDMAGKYDLINIKLDKTGGLTEALELRKEAEALGLGIMVGCMVGSSLAMAPAMMVAQGAQYVDLDAPLLLAEDRNEPLVYLGSDVEPPSSSLWG